MTAKFLHVLLLILLMTGCVAGTEPVIPTARPTLTPTITPRAIGAQSTPTPTATVRLAPTGGPSPTPLFGSRASGTSVIGDLPPTVARVINPNAPRIEYFEAGSQSIEPGGELTLYWSIRNVDSAVIYRLNQEGERTLIYNIPPDGLQQVSIGENERGRVDYLLIAGEGSQQVTQTISIPILCPIMWFFVPAPEACPSGEAQPATVTEQMFERGRMIYLSESDRVYALFNDGREPAWVDFPNLYDPAVHPERDEGFELALAGTAFVQPVGKLGFVWRGNDTVRNRLGNGTAPETNFEGFVQRAPTRGTSSADSVYISSATGTVIQLLPEGDSWQIITPG
jgi:hypothetical protein